ncbi:MAG TPA: hypothetical protein VL171_01165 [Verrucomicrobiae bacterium]|nr:hypothetical protein [Verrucomicrobiae bacterium]
MAAPKAEAAAPQMETAGPPAQTAAENAVTLWNFESKTTDGWAGTGNWSEADTVNDDPNFVKQGKYSLKINAKGSSGWNQDIAVNEGPFAPGFGKFKTITMDVYVPKESIEGLQYAQIFLVISSSANSWFQVPQDIKEGWNSLQYNIEPNEVSDDVSQVYLVFNSDLAFGGPVYIDNVVGEY